MGRPKLENKKTMETIRMRDDAWEKIKASNPNNWRSTCGEWLEKAVYRGGVGSLALTDKETAELQRKATAVQKTPEELVMILLAGLDTSEAEAAAKEAAKTSLDHALDRIKASGAKITPREKEPAPAPLPGFNPLGLPVASAPAQTPTAAPDFSRFFPNQPQAPLPSFPEPLPPVTIGFGPGKVGA